MLSDRTNVEDEDEYQIEEKKEEDPDEEDKMEEFRVRSFVGADMI